MGRIIFDLLLILGDIWVMIDNDDSKLIKCMAIISMVLLVISIVMRVLGMTVNI